ncbi:MAG: response regulator [Candidatus Thorarchaeota archaeon]|nr:response regulator [Candidatus Thorarchaeota archaeon]NIW14493.1 response regulator [Candidatus Thorarchaeota archaeon]NIW52573.1 response regulator [Candidatus Korarchaeota archaeon]
MTNNSKKILLGIKQDHEVNELKKLLREDGCQVFEADTAEEAFEVQKREHAQIVCVDLELPQMGGDELSLALNKGVDESHQKNYVIIVCNGRKADLERCGKCFANTYVRRPFDAEEVATRIRNILSANIMRATRVLVKVDVKSLYHNESFFCTSKDLSITGMLLEADKTLAKGDTISLSFFLPDEEKINASGEVVRVVRGDESKYIYGVEFKPLETDSKEVLNRFVKKQREVGNFF